MQYFQLPPSKLFPAGTRLFIFLNFGMERLVIQTGKQVTLELAGLASHASAVFAGDQFLEVVSGPL
jgi:hypothetical protein